FSIPDLDTIISPGLTQNWAGYWKLNETSGTNITDSSGQGGNGTLLGFSGSNLPWTNGFADGGARFRGSFARAAARALNYPKAKSNLSASAWVFAESRPSSATVLRNGSPTSGQFQWGLKDGSGRLDISINTATASFFARDPEIFPTNSWQHVAFTADGSSLKLFRNGRLIAETNYTGNLKEGVPEALGIGARLTDAGNGIETVSPGVWGGRIDEVAVWNRALSADEITAIHGAGAGLPSVLNTSIRQLVHRKASSVFLRFPFELSQASSLIDWRLRLRADDGVVLWLNGEKILTRNAPETPVWLSVASEIQGPEDLREAEMFRLNEFAGLFREGSNLLAAQLLNSSSNDPDLLLEAELEVASSIDTTNQPAYFLQPTPGMENRYGSTSLGPIISETQHEPDRPLISQDLTVRTRIQPTFRPVAEVRLWYRTMYSNELSLVMKDDGTAGDLSANDGEFTGVIPKGIAGPGQMIRYRITAADTAGSTQRLPLFTDRLNTEEYFGTVAFTPAMTSSIPVMHWFVRTPASAENNPGTQCSIYYAGEFYDNAYVRIRGGTSINWPKKSYKVELPEDHRFLIHPGVGRVTEFDWNTTYTDKSYVRALLVSEHQLDAGMPSPEIFHVRLEQNARFYSLTLFTEQPDKAFLRRHGLDDEGALYKGGPGANADSVSGFEKKTRKEEPGIADLQALLQGVARTGASLEQYVFDSLDLPAMANYIATTATTQNIDASDKNYFIYRDTNGNGEWRMLPWDMDLSFGPNALNTDNIVFNENFTSHPYIGARPYMLHDNKYNRILEAMVASPRGREMVLRRMRTLVDESLMKPYFQNRMRELETLIASTVVLDKAKWAGDAFFSGATYTLKQALDRIEKEYLQGRGSYLISKTIPGILAVNPGAQPPVAQVDFLEVAAVSGTSDREQEYLVLTNSNSFPIDLTGWTMEGDIQFRFKPGTVFPSKSTLYLSPKVSKFRARASGPRGGQGLFVQGDYKGELNGRGGSLSLRNDFGWLVSQINYTGQPTDNQAHLQVSEIMFAPPGPDGGLLGGDIFEFIELHNTSDVVTLNLNDVRFTEGIQFTFSNTPPLLPGARIVLARDAASFTSRYGVLQSPAGQYQGALENDGERLRLEDSNGEAIQDFSFKGGLHPMTDRLGFSLVRSQVPSSALSPNDDAWWKQGTHLLGSPGAPDTATRPGGVVINEILAASSGQTQDAIELRNLSGQEVSVGGWFLTDDFNTPRKYRIPAGTLIAPNGYLVIQESAFNAGPSGFSLSSEGDEVWLFSAEQAGLTGYHHGYTFDGTAPGITLGRHVTDAGEDLFFPQAQPTLGGPNSGPRLGPIIFSEIGAAPGTNIDDRKNLEFLELFNVSSNPIALRPPEGYSHAWSIEGGVRFGLPTNLVIAPLQRLVITGFDPQSNPMQLALFRQRFEVPAETMILGPWAGALDNRGEKLELRQPVSGSRRDAFVSVDRVDYENSSAWTAVRESGASLHRVTGAASSLERVSWVAAAPNPGTDWNGTGNSPEITREPTPIRILAGSSVEFRIDAIGKAPLNYQWFWNDTPLHEQTGPVLLIPSVQLRQQGVYRAVVYNSAGSARSQDAVLDLFPPPFITDPPLSRAVRTGTNFSLTVGAAGTGALRYQWRKSGVPIEGAVSNSYPFTGIQLDQAGVYDVVVTDDLASTISPAALITVFRLPVFVEHPDSTHILVGETLRLNISVDGTTPITYRWRRGTSSIAGQTNAQLTLTNIQLINLGSYSVIASNPAGNATSQVAVVTILLDADKDGMADDWESRWGLDLGSATDGLLDKDGDGVTNRQEYEAGTDPTNSSQNLRILDPALVLLNDTPALTFSFLAASNRSYSVQRSVSGGGAWSNIATVRFATTNRFPIITNPIVPTSQSWFRIQTPRAQ
ncbi:MAG: hypothetical protein FJ405_03605, partial [Verrucomicrobia bacterium]|nr:hypothetical protein [Verrucomicrobiota bacterium]